MASFLFKKEGPSLPGGKGRDRSKTKQVPPASKGRIEFKLPNRKSNRRHILLTGAHRTGTTFAGTMLSLPRNVGLIYEPFNKDHGLDGITKCFEYVSSDMATAPFYHKLLSDLLTGAAIYRFGNCSTRGCGASISLICSSFSNARPARSVWIS